MGKYDVGGMSVNHPDLNFIYLVIAKGGQK